MLKKCAAILLALLLPAFALAEDTVTANAIARATRTYQVTAPYSGVLLPFDWQNGDVVEADETLLAMDTIKVYAPVSGTVRAVFAEEGDQAANVLAQYGMLAAIQKAAPQVVNASTEGAYSKAENRIVHLGETVYLEQVYDRDNEGIGRIVAVDGKNYVVEVVSGEFDNHINIEIYRDPGCTTRSCIGSGRTDASAEIPVSGTGYVLAVHAAEGDSVQKGDLLFELAAQDADNTLRSAVLTAPAGGAVELSAVSGMQAYKGQLLARIHDLTEMEVVASVDEMDLDLVREGSSVTVLFDRYPGEEVQGTVVSISRIGMARQNAAYYDVTISVSTQLEVLPGMNAVVRLK
ncbi:MAG: efflux RND transporter periplasmic adaptor subunit [Clostridia bacterium]|nr:efflux RND transporter periplasmic adaptor subunit [Clostridia bacterium]